MVKRASFRLFRTGLTGSLITGLAAGGYLAGGGQLPPPVILAALCALTVLPVAAQARFRLSFPLLAGLLGAGQAWLHWSFCAFSGASFPVPGEANAGHAGHAGHAAAVLIPESFAAAPPGAEPDTGVLMFSAHLVATVVTAVLLAGGESALHAIAAWLRPLVQLPTPCAVVPIWVPGPIPASRIMPLGRPPLRLPTRRGPPTIAAAT